MWNAIPVGGCGDEEGPRDPAMERVIGMIVIVIIVASCLGLAALAGFTSGGLGFLSFGAVTSLIAKFMLLS